MEEEIKKVKTKKKTKKQSSKAGLYLTIIVISMFIGGAGMFFGIKYAKPITNTIINKSEKEVIVTDKGIADAVDKLYDAVVVVRTYKNNTLYSTGTGFVFKTVNDKAYILTNNHVVADGTSIKVLFTDGKEVETKVEGSDVYSDLAVLSLSSKEIIKVAELGSSESMRVGDTVFTLGCPLDTTYYWSVTRGVLSGKNRMVSVKTSSSTASDYVMKVLQTDASINSGNSGGPLANSNGQVVGITNMKLVSSGVEGVGFAIPIEDATTYAESIINGKSIERPLLGVSMLDLTSKYELYKQGITINTELTNGVVVVAVQENSPAEKGGLKRGDIITEIDGNKADSAAYFKYYLYKHNVGDTMKVKLEREGKQMEVEIKLNVSSKN